MTNLCSQGCDRPTQARGLCAPCYSTWHRSQKKYAITCAHCGVTAQVGRRPTKADPDRGKYCSRECSSRAALTVARPARVKRMKQESARPSVKQCAWCYAMHLGPGKYCGTDCQSADSNERYRNQRGPLRAAIEDADHKTLIREIEARCTIATDGCWNWNGRRKAGSKGGGEYPLYQNWQVHRLALEAKLGAPLGSQTAHHMCANSICVNPDHLQQVTSRENVAEMLARNDYVRRIVALESALRAADPSNPLLTEVPLAGVLRTA